jgi:transcriptional regulator with XRE-family HTH domain
MIDHTGSFKYKSLYSVSSAKLQSFVEGRRAPTQRQRLFLDKLREFISKTGWTQERIARTAKISQARLNNWLRERNYPDEPNMSALESALGIDRKTVDALVAENPTQYGPRLTPTQQRALDHFEALVKSGDPEITDHLERQIDLLYDLLQRRKGKDTD